MHEQEYRAASYVGRNKADVGFSVSVSRGLSRTTFIGAVVIIIIVVVVRGTSIVMEKAP